MRTYKYASICISSGGQVGLGKCDDCMLTKNKQDFMPTGRENVSHEQIVT